MINYLIVPLDQASTSFCYYSNPSARAKKSKLIPYNTLNRIVKYASENSLFINYLYGYEPLDEKYNKLIAETQHVKIIPVSILDQFQDEEVMVVINENELELAESIKDNFTHNLILRYPKSHLNKLAEYVELLMNKCKRLNLSLIDINEYKTVDLEEYKKQLDLIYDIVEDHYLSGHSVEISFRFGPDHAI